LTGRAPNTERNKSPDLITDEELRQYFLHIKNVKKYSRASVSVQLLCVGLFPLRAYRFFLFSVF